jgi:hypothetical protein
VTRQHRLYTKADIVVNPNVGHKLDKKRDPAPIFWAYNIRGENDQHRNRSDLHAFDNKKHESFPVWRMVERI